MKHHLFFPLALIAAGFVLPARSARAQDYSKIRIVRLSFVEGTVQYRQPGGEWQDAGVNLPIQEGFALRTNEGYAEVEFEDALAVRLGTNSILEFPVLAMLGGGRITRVEVSQGTVILSAKLKHQDELSVGASNLTVKVPHDGRFRIDSSSAENWVTVFHGKVEVESGSGTASPLGSGHTLHEDANGSSEIANNLPLDEFDKWVAHREDAMTAARNETSDMLSINGYTAGFADLYASGLWSYLPGYGLGWMPYGVAPGWMPFVNGQWQFMGPTGWNWVSPEPWGWIPYHFGSWINSPGIGWAWVPVGGASWVPATANWVQVNNQLGWIPKGPPLRSPTKTQQAALPSTVIMAHGDTGAITTGSRIPLAQMGMSVHAIAAPLPPLSTLPGQSMPTMTRANGVVRPNASVPSGLALVRLPRSAPSTLRAPSSSFARTRSAQLGSAPRTLLAPQSMTASSVMRAASSGGFGRGFSGGHAGGGGRMATSSGTGAAASSASASPHGSAGSASHAGGSTGSSGGHR